MRGRLSKEGLFSFVQRSNLWNISRGAVPTKLVREPFTDLGERCSKVMDAFGNRSLFNLVPMAFRLFEAAATDFTGGRHGVCTPCLAVQFACECDLSGAALRL
jgi:hypothetical protein